MCTHAEVDILVERGDRSTPNTTFYHCQGPITLGLFLALAPFTRIHQIFVIYTYSLP